MSTKDLSKDATAATTTGVSGTDGDSEKKKLLEKHDPARLWPLPLMAKCLLNISNLLLVATSRVEKMQKHQLTGFKVCE